MQPSTNAVRRSVPHIAILAILGLLLAMAPGLVGASARADSAAVDSARAHHAATASYILDNVKPVGLGREWQALGLARSDVDAEEWLDTYYTNLVADVVAKEGNLGAATNFERVIIALSALGKDVTDVGGHNLLTGLADMSRMGALNSTVFGLIALDTLNHEVPEVSGVQNLTTRQKLVDRALQLEIKGGGWAFFGNTPDPDMTGMTLQALAPYVGDPAVDEAIQRGIETLSAIQRPSGAFASYGNESAESTTQAIVALTALGIDPANDPRFIKEGGSAASALLHFAVEGGGFWYSKPGAPNAMSTEQGFYGLTDHLRFIDGKPSLYTMSVADPIVTATTLEASSSAGGSVTLVATVSGEGAAGSVEFYEDDLKVGESLVEAGTATLGLTGVAPGVHTYTALYVPVSSAFKGSASTAAAVTVDPAPEPTPEPTVDPKPTTKPAPVVKVNSKAKVTKVRYSKKTKRTTVRVEVTGKKAKAKGKVRITLKRNGKVVKTKLVKLNKNGKAKYTFGRVKKKGLYKVTVRYTGSKVYKKSKISKAKKFRIKRKR